VSMCVFKQKGLIKDVYRSKCGCERDRGRMKEKMEMCENSVE
jgi:hypothetical protein